MTDIQDLLIKAWIECLGTLSAPVFDTSVPDDYEGNYFLLRVESETEQPISRRFWTKPILVTEAVAVFETIIDPKIARAMQSEIVEKVSDNLTNNLVPQAGIQIGNVYQQTKNMIEESDGTKYYHRIITRWRHDVMQPKNT